MDQKPSTTKEELTTDQYKQLCYDALVLTTAEWDKSRNYCEMPDQWEMGPQGKVPMKPESLKDDFASVREVLKRLLTAHMFEPSEELHLMVDQILDYENSRATVVGIDDILNINHNPAIPGVHIGLWQGDICKLKIGAIVNAANCYMLGCTTPNHPCIDNIIHDRSGTRLRQACRNMMREQGFLEKTAVAKITPAYCLPSQYVIHTVGPIYPRTGMEVGTKYLIQSYEACLQICKDNNVRSLALCCISTGVFGFPQEPACHIALKTVEEWLKKDENYKHFDSVVFNVFKHEDLVLYRKFGHLYYGPFKQAEPAKEAKVEGDEPQEAKVEGDNVKEPEQQ